MRRLPALSLILLLALGLGACGSDDEPSETAESAKTTPRSAPERSPLAVTDGRLGDAVSATDENAVEELLDQGGEIPDDIAEPPSGQTGVGAGSGCKDTQLDVSAATLDRVSRSTFCLMNAERRKRGLPALRRQRLLATASVRHSRDMVGRAYFAHDSPSGRKLVDRLRAVRYIPRTGRWLVGENLAWGSGAIARPEAIVSAWMASPAHRENLLSPKYAAVGMGVVLGTPTGRPAGATFTTDFGRLG